MKIEGYEEISEKEYGKISDSNGLSVWDNEACEFYYFKKAQKFPIVFENKDYKIEVEKGGIRISGKIDNDWVGFNYDKSFPLLVKAVEKAKELMKKNETD